MSFPLTDCADYLFDHDYYYYYDHSNSHPWRPINLQQESPETAVQFIQGLNGFFLLLKGAVS